MKYTELLREAEARAAARPKRQYLSNEEFSKLKAALTRAKNSGDPAKILVAVEKAVKRFNETVWPDAWSSWRIALEDGASMAQHQAYSYERAEDWDGYDRLMALSNELHAASLILFR